MKISFDFDSTLAEARMQKLAAKFIAEGHDVWITTSRPTKPNQNTTYTNKIVFKVAEKLGIPEQQIQFTDHRSKHLFLKGFDIHFDDDQVEIEALEAANIGCLGVLVYDP